VMDTLLAEPEIDNAPAKYEKTRALSRSGGCGRRCWVGGRR
jgi:hypothetical protein